MTRLGVVLVVSLMVAGCSGGTGSTATDTEMASPTSLATTSSAISAPDTAPATDAASTTGPTRATLSQVWRDSACLKRFDPPRAAPPDGYVPHLICEDDPSRLAPLPRGFRDPTLAIDAVLQGPNQEEGGVGFVGVGSARGYDYVEGEEVIEVILVGPTTPELVAAVKATVEYGTEKTVMVRKGSGG